MAEPSVLIPAAVLDQVVRQQEEIEALRQRVKELEPMVTHWQSKYERERDLYDRQSNELAALKSQQAAHMPVKTYCGGKPNYCKEQE